MSSPIPSHERRRFLNTAAAGAVLGPASLMLSGRLLAADSPGTATKAFPNFAKGEVVRTGGKLTLDGRFAEAPREIPIAGHSDVLVVGAGPAGIGAALGAARAGVKTQLIE